QILHTGYTPPLGVWKFPLWKLHSCKGEKGKMRRRHFVIWPLLIAALIAGFKYCSAEKVTNPETGRTTRVALSSEKEEQLGFQSYSAGLSHSAVFLSGPDNALVVRVAQRLAAVTGPAAKDFKWQVNLVQSP